MFDDVAKLFYIHLVFLKGLFILDYTYTAMFGTFSKNKDRADKSLALTHPGFTLPTKVPWIWLFLNCLLHVYVPLFTSYTVFCVCSVSNPVPFLFSSIFHQIFENTALLTHWSQKLLVAFLLCHAISGIWYSIYSYL